MQKLWVSLCVGQNQDVGGTGWGSRGWGILGNVYKWVQHTDGCL